jgi:hypothetical protein
MGGKQSKQCLKDEELDETPLTEEGHCNIYDAALIGDWDKLIQLCTTSVIVDDDKEEITTKDCNGNGDIHIKSSKKDEGDVLGISMLSSSRRQWIEGLDVFAGGHDYDGINLDISITDDTDTNGQEEKNKEKQSTASSPSDVKSFEQQQQPVDEEQQEPTPYKLFIDAKGNTPLHLACRRDPPISAVRALLALHRKSVWMRTDDGWIPLHLLCHCGCDVDVANILLSTMKETLDKYNIPQSKNDKDESREEEKEDVDPLLPRDKRGRTPLHLACASSRSRRRPDLVRLLLLRSNDPKRASLCKDWVVSQRLGLDLAIGDLIIGGLLNDKDVDLNINDDDASVISQITYDTSYISTANGEGNASVATQKANGTIKQASTTVGRSPLVLVQDDYKEELEEALLPGFSIPKALAACRGESVDDNDDEITTFNECWSLLTLLLLAAGTDGPIDRVKEVLGSTTGEGSDELSSLKSVQDIINDFQSIHRACQYLEEEFCPPQFKELAKKLLKGEVDKRKIGSVSSLKEQWEQRSTRSTGSGL